MKDNKAIRMYEHIRSSVDVDPWALDILQEVLEAYLADGCQGCGPIFLTGGADRSPDFIFELIELNILFFVHICQILHLCILCPFQNQLLMRIL